MRFKYQCPDCLTTNDLHEFGCEYEDVDRSQYEKAYTDIISVLSTITCSKPNLIDNAHQWSCLHEDVLTRLQTIGHVEQTAGGYYTLVAPNERKSDAEPHIDPLATIYRHGTVPGCHDDGLFALMAFYSHIDLTWEDTKGELLEWYERTGSWERGGFEEPSPEALLEKKKHIWRVGYGWEQKGRRAERLIQRSQSQHKTDRSSDAHQQTA